VRAFHFTAASHALDNVRQQRLKVARIMDLNDPFEFLCGDLGDPQARNAFRAFKEYESERSGILCFTRGWRNPLMWSHYGVRHKGAALEFELHHELPEGVIYESRRFPFDVPAILTSGGFTDEHARRIYATKSAHWKYERELRVATRLSECIVEKGLYFEPFSRDMRLIGLILGPFCELTPEQVRNAVPSGAQIRLRRARLAFRSYNVVRDKSFREEVIVGMPKDTIGPDER
jgi:hypothetical protein